MVFALAYPPVPASSAIKDKKKGIQIQIDMANSNQLWRIND